VKSPFPDFSVSNSLFLWYNGPKGGLPVKKRLTFLLLFLLLLTQLVRAEDSLPADFLQILPHRGTESSLSMGRERILRLSDGESTRYTFPDGDVYFQHTGALAPQWTLPFKPLTVRTLQEDGTWYVVRNPIDFSSRHTVFLDTEGLHLVLVPPLAYAETRRDCLQALPELDGEITVTRQKGSFVLSLSHPEGEGQWHWYLLASSRPLVEWTSSQKSIWKGYDMTGQYRFCQKGFYQLSPESYDPTGDGVYFLNPASYIPAKFIATGGSRAADKLGVAMLDTVRRNLQGRGHIPISTESSWLKTDYGIGPGYYDTRWSTDLGLALSQADKKFGLPDFRVDVQAMADHVADHIRQNGFTLPGKTGLLSPDYSWDGSYKTPHCSLNHALAEALLLYQGGREQEADALVLALAEADWLRPDGNLKYGLMPDGREVGTDYPYLTYNDLLLLRKYYETTGRQYPKALQTLMDSKLQYMLSQNITGYLPS